VWSGAGAPNLSDRGRAVIRRRRGLPALPLADEAIEFLAVPRHMQVAQVVVELVHLFVELAALLVEALELLFAVAVEGSIAARGALARLLSRLTSKMHTGKDVTALWVEIDHFQPAG